MVIKESLKFESDLYNLINSCGLPVDTAFYILKSVYLDFKNTVYEYAQKGDDGVVEEEKIIPLEDNEEKKEIFINAESDDTNA